MIVVDFGRARTSSRHEGNETARATCVAKLPGRWESQPWFLAVVADHVDRMHEVRSSLAAVAGAVHSLTCDPAVPPQERERSEYLLGREVERLQRLVAPPAVREEARSSGEVSLDEVIESVARARELCGQVVDRSPSGCRILDRCDDVVVFLNISLTNSARHASGFPTQVHLVGEEAVVRVGVSDEGPGVPEPLRPQIFHPGRSQQPHRWPGPRPVDGSRDGARLGGTLACVGEPGRGATFEGTLPRADSNGAA